MKSVSPESIRASRVYFTEFDRVTYSQVAWTPDDVEAIRRNMERKLKLVVLVNPAEDKGWTRDPRSRAFSVVDGRIGAV